MALADFSQVFDRSYCTPYLQTAAREGEADHEEDGNADFGRIECGMAGNDARFFKTVDTLGDRGSRQANLPADLRKELAGILLPRLPVSSNEIFVEIECGWNGSVGMHLQSLGTGPIMPNSVMQGLPFLQAIAIF